MLLWSRRPKAVNRDSKYLKHNTQVQDVKSEEELIHARVAMLTTPQNIHAKPICPSHRSSSGLSWKGWTKRCRVPWEISRHKNIREKMPKGQTGHKQNFLPIHHEKNRFTSDQRASLTHVNTFYLYRLTSVWSFQAHGLNIPALFQVCFINFASRYRKM